MKSEGEKKTEDGVDSLHIVISLYIFDFSCIYVLLILRIVAVLIAHSRFFCTEVYSHRLGACKMHLLKNVFK